MQDNHRTVYGIMGIISMCIGVCVLSNLTRFRNISMMPHFLPVKRPTVWEVDFIGVALFMVGLVIFACLHQGVYMFKSGDSKEYKRPFSPSFNARMRARDSGLILMAFLIVTVTGIVLSIWYR